MPIFSAFNYDHDKNKVKWNIFVYVSAENLDIQIDCDAIDQGGASSTQNVSGKENVVDRRGPSSQDVLNLVSGHYGDRMVFSYIRSFAAFSWITTFTRSKNRLELFARSFIMRLCFLWLRQWKHFADISTSSAREADPPFCIYSTWKKISHLQDSLLC